MTQPPQDPTPQQPGPPRPQPLSPGEEQGWGVGMHLGGVFLSWVIPLVLWLVFRERSRMLDDHGKTAVNWQITLFIIYVVGFITSFILIGFLILFAAGVLNIIFGILAAIAAYNRRPYRYPMSITFIR